MPDMESGQRDWGQTRARLDQGLTGEKSAQGFDPAAAPTETDAESAGTPMPAETRAMPATGQRLAPPHHLMELTWWRTPRPETFGAWRKPGQHEGPILRLAAAWGAVLVVLGLGLGLWGLT